MVVRRLVSIWAGTSLGTLFFGMLFGGGDWGLFWAYYQISTVIAWIVTFTYGLLSTFLIDLIVRKRGLNRVFTILLYGLFGIMFGFSILIGIVISNPDSNLGDAYFLMGLGSLVALLIGMVEELLKCKMSLLSWFIGIGAVPVISILLYFICK